VVTEIIRGQGANPDYGQGAARDGKGGGRMVEARP